ncbi:MAG: hypothetical protein AAGB48_03415 [Planctomycetota bacterium]
MLPIALAAAALTSHAAAQPETAAEVDESRFLTNLTQLTFAEDFVKAGESYFSPDDELIVFQGVPVPPEGEEPSPHYDMYVGRYHDFEYRRSLIQAGSPIRFQFVRLNRPGSANTCGWFHPSASHDHATIIFGSTIEPPSEENVPGYQRATGRYSWAFPSEMEIVSQEIASARIMFLPGYEGTPMINSSQQTIFEKPGYTAECSYSPDGRHILYANVNEERSNELGRADADLWVFDTTTREHTLIVEAEGYDGGPFFSPDGTWICYRSDRRGDNLLQLFVAELEFDDTGAITGIKQEVQLTDNGHVNWAPFWHPSGELLVYASSEVSHRNYEVFAIAFNAADPKASTPIRITAADGFDGLPVFDSTGDRMMWTAQRGNDTQWGGRPSSQLWIADFDAEAVRAALAEANE